MKSNYLAAKGSGIKGKLLVAALMASTCVSHIALFPAVASAQTAQPVAFQIPSGSLASALTAFGRQSGLQITYVPAITSGKRSPSVSGAVEPTAALRQILGNSGLEFNISGDTVTIFDPAASSQLPAAVDTSGTTVLDTITVKGGRVTNPSDMPYETAGSTSYISEEQIERYRGTSPSDILKNATGVLSGESRASGGVDVNIRGMQSNGRVGVSVDGASNAMTVYRGYQGVSNRSYIDPDFIGGVSIERGPSTGATGAGAIGGTVSISTVSADDIIPEGQTSAIRLKVEGGTNTSPISTLTREPNLLGPGAVNNPFGGTNGDVDRPGLLVPTSGSASVVYAHKSENFDLVAGFARRRAGNYHAGTNGKNAGSRVDCDASVAVNCNTYKNWWRRGQTAYLPGEEVLNTSQDNYSTLLKGTFRHEDQKLELGYSRYDSMYGETYPAGFYNPVQRTYETTPSHTTLNSYTARYSWNPDSDLIDVKANAWFTHLDDEAQVSNTSRMHGRKWTQMWGFDVTNTSRWDMEKLGDFSLQYGIAYQSEQTAPRLNNQVEINNRAFARDGERQEFSTFSNATLSPTDWLSLNGGLRWHEARTLDRYYSENTEIQKKNFNDLDYSAGLTVTPLEGLQLYGTYRNAARMPSLFEAGRGFQTKVSPDLGPETASTWEAGVNLMRDGVFTSDDGVRLKLGYFNNTVDNYIYRRAERVEYIPGYFLTDLTISNLHQAKFAGLEFQSRYENGGFSADLQMNYYTNVEFCRSAGNCTDNSLASDYTTNYVPPKYSGSLVLSQKLFDDALTISGKATYIGKRAAGSEIPSSGANPLIALIPWEPVTLFDLYASYKVNDNMKLHASVENLFDTYYVDPLNLSLLPSPGRTIRFGMTGTLAANSQASSGDLFSAPAVDWSGFYAGVHAGWGNSNANASNYLFSEDNYQNVSPNEYHLGVADGALGGLQAGYNFRISQNVFLGVEGEVSKADLKGHGSVVSYPSTPTGTYDPEQDMFRTRYNWTSAAKARIGVAGGRFMLYGTAGVAMADVDVSETWFGARLAENITMTGWTAGGGVEYALTDKLSLRGDYSFTRLRGGVEASAFNERFNVTRNATWTAKDRLDSFKLGVNYHF